MFLAHIDGEEDFIRFSGLYTRCTVWAEEALQDGHDGYHRISQMNDRLINSQRALSRANSLIALLEQDELTSRCASRRCTTAPTSAWPNSPVRTLI